MISTRLLAGLPREVKVLVSASFFVALGFGIIIPAMPLFAKSFGVNNSAVGLIVSMFAIARFSSGLVSGKFVDLFGERIVFAIGITMVSVSALLCALAQSYAQLLLFRTAGGLGSSMFSVAAGSIIMRSVSDEQRGRAQSIYNGSFLVGGITGPAVGGLISAVSLRAPFFIYSGTLLCSGTIGFFFLATGRSRTKKVEADSDAMRISEAIKLRPYQIALTLSFVTNWVLFGLRTSILPLFVTEDLHSTTTVVGIGFTIAALLQGLLLLPAGNLSDRKGRPASLKIGTTVVLAGTLLLTFAVHPWMYLVSMGVVGLGGAFLSTAPANIVADVIRGKSGQVIALWQMAGDAGMIVGPITVGILADLFSFRMAFLVTAIVFSIAVFAAFTLGETRKSHLNKAS
ncbi:MAG: MFS transporter [Actinobacteria bacterium]|nr:MFS transporter [Actinomycetota bacterium]